MLSTLYQVFSDPQNSCQGNTSTVILLDKPLADDQYQRIASDQWQPATTFLVRERADRFEVRWFAPDGEIGLCGHGSLAAIAFVHDHFGTLGPIVLAHQGGTLSGEYLRAHTASITLESFEALRELKAPKLLSRALGTQVLEYYETANKNIVVVNSQEVVKNLQPDYVMLRRMDTFGYAVTARGTQTDFVCRTLVPHVQQLEDPATGSSHAVLAPFWAARLGKERLTSLQLSKRGGKFLCDVNGKNVTLTGHYRRLQEGQLIEAY